MDRGSSQRPRLPGGALEQAAGRSCPCLPGPADESLSPTDGARPVWPVRSVARVPVPTPVQGSGLQRIADVPIYFADALVRRAPSLQKTRDAQVPVARMNAATLAGVGAADGRSVRVKGSEGVAVLNAVLDNTVPDGCVRIAAAHPSTATIGGLSDMIVVECV